MQCNRRLATALQHGIVLRPMRQEWQRPTAEVGLDNDAVAQLVRPALPDTPVTGFEMVVGGLANTNVKVLIAGPPHRGVASTGPSRIPPATAPRERVLVAVKITFRGWPVSLRVGNVKTTMRA